MNNMQKPEGGRTLPLRVTGVVFWGLVVMGLVLAFFMLDDLRDRIQLQQRAAVDRFMAGLYEAWLEHPPRRADDLAPLVERLARSSGQVRGIRLRIGDEEHRFGQPGAPGTQPFRRPLVLPAGPEGASASITLYLPSVEEGIATARRRLLAGMVGLFLVFGIVLQWVLGRMLSRPFQQMTRTARAISAGEEARRFDTARDDEFGYLACFINQALDQAREQKAELHKTLERAVASEQALQRQKDQAEVTLHSIGDAVITTDPEGRIEYMNPIAEALLGCRLDEICGTPVGKIMRLIDEDSGQPLTNPVDLCLAQGERIAEGRHKLLQRHDGEQVAIADSAAPIRDREGRLTGVVMVFHDVGQARQLARQLSFHASHDPLTGLYNRREFELQLQRLFEGARESGAAHAMCYIDLDQFKVVNDVCGHGAGDELLRQISALLQRQVREADVLARLGGDEFGVLLRHCSAEQAVRVAENMRTAVRGFRFLWEDRSFEIGASIGVVAINEHSRSMAELLSAADIACYAAKDAGRNRVHLYEPSDTELNQRRGEMNWVSEVRRALDEHRFCLLYQPIVSLCGDSGVREVHYEFLLRMLDPQGQEVPPMAFLPAAERYHMMPDIDRWVIQAVMRLLADSPRVPERGRLLINLSGTSLADPGFVDCLVQHLEQAVLPPSRFCFEITESSAISNLRLIGEAIRRLRGMGCRFTLDDFGSGLSAFGYFKEMEVDYIKIDGGLVRNMLESDIDAAMVRAINDIGHAVGVQTIAEFIETPAIQERLVMLGVDFGQGHAIARPRPADELLGSPQLDLA
ncbi:MAG TPA: EAL domain-containing protein [Gammaproteobacteria bacterium]|nr:EAL domain-containing protein [Gammaproteobacteria bacterium]